MGDASYPCSHVVASCYYRDTPDERQHVFVCFRQRLFNADKLVGYGVFCSLIKASDVTYLFALAVLAYIRVVVFAAIYGRFLNPFLQYLVHCSFIFVRFYIALLDAPYQ